MHEFILKIDSHISILISGSLPPAYVVRREGNSFTLFVNPHLGGGFRSSRGGGVRSSRPGGVRSVSWPGGGQVQLARGGQVQPAGQVSQLTGGGSGQSANGVGGVRSSQGASGPAGGVRSSRQGGGQVSQQEGGQHLAPSCRQYASCVHAGGLSCYIMIFVNIWIKQPMSWWQVFRMALDRLPGVVLCSLWCKLRLI